MVKRQVVIRILHGLLPKAIRSPRLAHTRLLLVDAPRRGWARLLESISILQCIQLHLWPLPLQTKENKLLQLESLSFCKIVVASVCYSDDDERLTGFHYKRCRLQTTALMSMEYIHFFLREGRQTHGLRTECGPWPMEWSSMAPEMTVKFISTWTHGSYEEEESKYDSDAIVVGCMKVILHVLVQSQIEFLDWVPMLQRLKKIL